MLARLEDRDSGQYLQSSFAGITEDILICETVDSQKDYSDFLNHSCDPNVGMDDCLTVIAIVDIAPKTELTYDYAFCEADENWKLKSKCNCGSNNCRRVITGKDWRLYSTKSKWYPFFSPFIQRRILENERKL